MCRDVEKTLVGLHEGKLKICVRLDSEQWSTVPQFSLHISTLGFVLMMKVKSGLKHNDL